MPPRKNPPKLMVSELTGTVYVVTRYKLRKDLGDGQGSFESQEKYDVTDQFLQIVRDLGYTLNSGQGV